MNEPMTKYPKCKLCDDEIFKLKLCIKHCRFRQMRESAKHNKKYVPSYLELENIYAKIVDMLCPCCKVKMIWFAKKSYSNVVSLQHDDNGTIRLICKSCNSRHAIVGDKFYNLDKSKRLCNRCKNEKSFNEFANQKDRWMKKSSVCRQCKSLEDKEYRNRNKELLNRRRRERYLNIFRCGRLLLKLDAEKVRIARELYYISGKTSAELAGQFGVSQSSMIRALHGDVWGRVKNSDAVEKAKMLPFNRYRNMIKLDKDQVEQVKSLKRSGMRSVELAKLFSVSANTINRICRGSLVYASS